MQIRIKLLLSFLFLTLLILAQFILNQYYTGEQSRLVRQMIVEHDISRQLSGLAQAAQSIRRYEKEYFIYVEEEQRRSKYYQEFQQARKIIEGLIGSLRISYTAIENSLQLKQLEIWEQATAVYVAGFEAIHEQVLGGQINGVREANEAIRDAKNTFRVVLSGVAETIDRQLEIAQAEADQIYRLQEQSGLIFSLFTMVSVMLGLFISFKVPISITRPIKELTRIADGISRGKIKEHVEATGSPEVRELARSIDRLRVATQGLLKRLQTNRAAGS